MSKDIYRSQIRIGKEWALVRINSKGEASLEIPGYGDFPMTRQQMRDLASALQTGAMIHWQVTP